MKIIVDKRKQLNYHPLVVYFILQPKDYKMHGQNLEQLNKYTAFTRGIFKFRAIARGNEYSHDLSDELIYTINKYNVILRLVDDQDGNYNYALGKMNFNQSPDLFEQSLQAFIVGACRQNIKNLKDQSQYYMSDSEESKENASILTSLAQGFKNAIDLKGFKHGMWGKTVNPSVSLHVHANHKATDKVPHSFVSTSNNLPSEIIDIGKSVYNILPNRKAKDDFKRMMQFFEANMDAPALKDSDMYVQGTIDNTKSKELSTDQKSRIKQGGRPQIIISITKVTSQVLKHDIKKAWGVKINIDGVDNDVYIGSTAAAMVYICTLLKQKMGSHLYREAFKHGLPDKQKRHQDVLWLENVYSALFPGAYEDFEEWYSKMKLDSCKFINQGKSESIRVIKRNLSNFPEALYYCCVQKIVDERKKTYYYIDIPEECIKISDDLSELIP